MSIDIARIGNPNINFGNVAPVADREEVKRTKETDELVIKREAIQQKKQAADEQVVVDAIENANRISIGSHTEIRFSVHEKTKEIMVKIVDLETNKVIKEIPPEKILDLVSKLIEMTGILFDEKR